MPKAAEVRRQLTALDAAIELMGSAQLLHELPDNRSEDCEKDNRDDDTEDEGRHAPFYHGGEIRHACE